MPSPAAPPPRCLPWNCRGSRSLNPPLARAAALDQGAERDEDVLAEEQRMKDLLNHRSGGAALLAGQPVTLA